MLTKGMHTGTSFSRRRFLYSGLAAGTAGFVGFGATAQPAQALTRPFTPNEELVADFSSRRGGSIGTAGKAAVAFRCDHHLNSFASKLFPLHQKYAIPVTIAALSKMFVLPKNGNGNSDLSFPKLQKLALENGFEVANHGATHLDAPTDQKLREEIVYARNDLSRDLPQLPIELFTPPGVGGTRFQGFAGGKTQASFRSFLAGRLITEQHALSTGYVPGYWPMTGDPLDSMGNVHLGIENADYARRGPSFVAAARKQGKGVCFMYHPSLVDDVDLAAIEDFFAWCANERDAGRLEVLTTTGLMMSSFTSNERHDALGSGNTFSKGWSGWNGGSSKWAICTEAGTSFARRGSASGELFKDFPINASGGSTRQLRILARSAAGIRLRVEVLDPSNPALFNSVTTMALPASTGFRPVHKYVTLPLVGTSTFRVRITPVSGGELHLQHPELLAA